MWIPALQEEESQQIWYQDEQEHLISTPWPSMTIWTRYFVNRGRWNLAGVGAFFPIDFDEWHQQINCLLKLTEG